LITSAFGYHRARDVRHALALRAEHGDDAKFIAGGQSLVSMMKLRLVSPSVLIDLNDIDALRSISRNGTTLIIGALATHAAVADDETVAALLPALSDAAGVIGDPQVRNRGTLGGATAHGDPSADYPAVLLALDAQITLESAGGSRIVAADDFFLGMFETELAEGELLTSVSFATAGASAYEKLEHPASGYPVVGAAARLTIAGNVIERARIALTGLGEMAVRAAGVEDRLSGVDTSDERAIARACRDAAAGIDIAGDAHAPEEYRRAMADVFCERVITHAIRRARDGAAQP
jgi:aerobic carbon-monoxide dehydrogenase medium subunit